MPRQRITIINDDEIYMELMRDLLEEEGYKVRVWDRKENAYYLIKRERPQLIILDIRLNNRDEGWKLLEQVRLDPATTHIPAIVCSADTQLLRWKRRHLRTLGIAAMEKPFRLEDLLHEVRTILEPGG